MRATGTFPEVPLFDLRLEPQDVEAVAEVLRSGWLTAGPRTAEFEERFAQHLGVRHAIAVSSCTAALHLAYLGAGVGPGDEVIVPSMTFAATAAAVVYCGATPVFADIVGPGDPGLDPDDVERRITPRTKAVCVVHFAGYPAAVDRLRALCDAHGLALIEDVAHAPSAELHGRRLGAWGLAGAFSFFSNKILSCGEGGLLATDDDELAELARRLRSQGMTAGSWAKHTRASESYDGVGLGFNYRIDEPRAALLLSRFGRLEAEIEQRRVLTRRYRELLAEVDGIEVPFRDEDVARSSCYVMPIVTTDPERRNPVRHELRHSRGIQTSLFYPAIHEFTAYRERFPTDPLPHTERWARSEITIPLYQGMDDALQERVVQGIAEAVAA